MTNYDFKDQKKRLKDTNLMFHNWLELLRREGQYNDLNLQERYNFVINRQQNAAVYCNIGHHSSNARNSRYNATSRRTGAHNVAKSNVEMDVNHISTTLNAAHRAAQAFFNVPAYRRYRLAVAIRSDFHRKSRKWNLESGSFQYAF